MIKQLSIVFVLCLFLFSCGNVKTMYYWGDYTSLKYEYKKNPSEENLYALINEMQHIVEESHYRNLNIAPGIYAELGYCFLLLEKNEEAELYFKKELQVYPESEKLISYLLNQKNGISHE